MKGKSDRMYVLLIVPLLLISCEKNKDDVNTLIDFEELLVNTGGYWNGSDGSGGFVADNAFFPNEYVDAGDYNYWSGWGYSNNRDTATSGIGNQYSCYAGKGANSSVLFGLVYSFGEDTLFFEKPQVITSVSVANTTYTAIAMREGDAFAKKFGGPSGDDPDYFTLRIKGIDKDGNMTGYVDIYLADFRFEDNAQDYIAKAWTEVPLEFLGKIQFLTFSFDSSDKGEFGINTPAYACIDNIRGYIPQ